MKDINQERYGVHAWIPLDILERVTRTLQHVITLTPQQLEQYREKLERADNRAFTAYLLNAADIDGNGPDPVEAYDVTYVGTYPSKQAVLDDAAHLLGDSYQLTEEEEYEAVRTHVVDLLRWARGTIWDHLESTHHIVATAHEVYVFRKVG